MNDVLKKLLNEYRLVLESPDLSNLDKLSSVKQMSSLLHNELFDLFEKTMGTDVVKDYNQFISMANNLNNNVYKHKYDILEENGYMYILFNSKKKLFLSAKEISLAFLNTEEPDYIDLFALFISNDEDLVKFNLLF